MLKCHVTSEIMLLKGELLEHNSVVHLPGPQHPPHYMRACNSSQRGIFLCASLTSLSGDDIQLSSAEHTATASSV